MNRVMEWVQFHLRRVVYFLLSLVLNAVFIIWLIINFQSLLILGYGILLVWSISFALGVIMGIDRRRYKQEDEDNLIASFTDRRSVRWTETILYSITFFIILYAIEVLEHNEGHPFLLLGLLVASLLGPVTFALLGLYLTYPSILMSEN